MHNTNIPCGCLIEYEGDQFHQDYSIDWCPLHKAASDLLEALRAVTNLLPKRGGDEVNVLVHNMAAAAIKKATGDPHGPQ